MQKCTNRVPRSHQAIFLFDHMYCIRTLTWNYWINYMDQCTIYKETQTYIDRSTRKQFLKEKVERFEMQNLITKNEKYHSIQIWVDQSGKVAHLISIHCLRYVMLWHLFILSKSTTIQCDFRLLHTLIFIAKGQH